MYTLKKMAKKPSYKHTSPSDETKEEEEEKQDGETATDKQAYALQKVAASNHDIGFKPDIQDITPEEAIANNFDHYKSMVVQDLATAFGGTGVVLKNLYDTAKKHDGSAADSFSRFGAGIGGGALGGYGTRLLTDATGLTHNGLSNSDSFAGGLVRGGINTIGMLGGQHLGQKGYDALRKKMKSGSPPKEQEKEAGLGGTLSGTAIGGALGYGASRLDDHIDPVVGTVGGAIAGGTTGAFIDAVNAANNQPRPSPRDTRPSAEPNEDSHDEEVQESAPENKGPHFTFSFDGGGKPSEKEVARNEYAKKAKYVTNWLTDYAQDDYVSHYGQRMIRKLERFAEEVEQGVRDPADQEAVDLLDQITKLYDKKRARSERFQF